MPRPAEILDQRTAAARDEQRLYAIACEVADGAPLDDARVREVEGILRRAAPEGGRDTRRRWARDRKWLLAYKRAVDEDKAARDG